MTTITIDVLMLWAASLTVYIVIQNEALNAWDKILQKLFNEKKTHENYPKLLEKYFKMLDKSDKRHNTAAAIIVGISFTSIAARLVYILLTKQ